MMKKINFSICMGVVFVWFTTMFGGGWATGAQALAWFAGSGWTALWMPMVGMGMTSLLGYLIVEWARKHKLGNYRTFMENIYGNKVLPTIHEIGLIMGTIIGMGSVLSATGAVFRSWGLNYWLGVVLMCVICVVGCLFGTAFVRKVSTFMGVIIGILIAVLFIIVLINRPQAVPTIVANRTMYMSYGDAWYDAVYFGCINCGMLMTILPVMDNLKCKEDSFWTCVFGFIVNSAVVIMLNYVILTFMPNITSADVPLMYAITQLGNPWLLVAYYIILFFAIITTGIGMMYTYAVRFAPLLTGIRNERVRYTIILATICAVAAGASAFGLMTLVGKGYTVTAYINMALVLIGVPIIIAIKSSHRHKSIPR